MASKFIVAVYMCDRSYGGPEEGGWYYDTGELVRVLRVFPSFDRASSYCRRANDLIRATLNRGRRDVSSVLSDGIYAAEVHEDFAPSYYPAARPHYE